MSSGFFSAKKGAKAAKHQYPLMQVTRGGGLPMSRLCDKLKMHRPVVDERKKGNRAKSDHLCQVCYAVGKLWVGETYRGGVKRPRRAKIICAVEGCIANYCSYACFNLWHIRQDHPDV